MAYLELFLLVIVCCGLVKGLSSEGNNTYTLCDETNKESVCYHGTCIFEEGCECDPCYTGENCNEYKNSFQPVFIQALDQISIDAESTNVIYQPLLEDGDYQEHCETKGERTCICGEVDISFSKVGNWDLFKINNMTGEIRVKEGIKLEADQKYFLTLRLTGIDLESKFSIIYSEMNLTVWAMHQDNEFEEFDQMVSGEKGQVFPLSTRKKRETSVVSLDQMDIQINTLSDPITLLQPGNTMEFEICIILPSLATAGESVDLKVEIFASNTDGTSTSGATTLALFGVEVVSVGNKLKKQDTNALLNIADGVITYQNNQDLTHINDYAKVDFGMVYNEDTYVESSTTTDPSTIKIKFKTTMLINTLFTEDNVKLLVGVEYAAGQYIYVSEGSIPYETASASIEKACNMTLTLEAADDVPQYSGVLALVSGPILIPYEKIYIEFYNMGPDHDFYSIENLRVNRVGSKTNLVDMPVLEDPKYYKSITGETNIRAIYSFWIFNHELTDYENPVDTNHLYEFTASIFAYNAPVGSKIEIYANLKTNKVLWVAKIELNVVAPLTPPPGSIVSMEHSPIVAPEVSMGLSYPWEVKIMLEEGNTDIDCTFTAPASESVTGVKYGSSGANVARLPDLNSVVDYAANKWMFPVNMTILPADRVVSPPDMYVSLIVTVTYLSGTATGIDVTCGDKSVSLMPTMIADTTSVNPTLLLSSIPSRNNWYEGSTMAVQATFSSERLVYPDLKFTVSIPNTAAMQYDMCAIRITDIKSGMSAMIKPQATIDEIAVKTTDGSLGYNNSIEVPLGPLGTTILPASMATQNNFTITTYIRLPKGQTLDGTQTVSTDLLDPAASIIASGDKTITLTPKGIASTPGISPDANVIVEPSDNTVMSEQMLKVRIRTIPQYVNPYIIEATAGDNAMICEIVILNVGENFACVDMNPHGKEDDPQQSITVVPVTPKVSYKLDLGVLANHGSPASVSGEQIADANTIEIGIIARQKDPTITFPYEITTVVTSGTNTYTNTTSLTTDATAPGTEEGPVIDWTSFPSSLDVYEKGTTSNNLTVQIPPFYARSLKIKVSNTGSSDKISVCGLTVFHGGRNIPCLNPLALVAVIEEVGEEISYTIDLGRIVYHQLANETEDSQIILQIMTKLKSPATTADILVTATESDVDYPLVVTMNAGLEPQEIDLTMYNFTLAADGPYTGVPGTKMWVAATLTFPPDLSVAAELTVLTNATEGHAEATVHNFRYGDTVGENIACHTAFDETTMVLSQGFTDDGNPFAHTSQNNTLFADLGGIANNGQTYRTQTNETSHDQLIFEAEIMIADHHTIANGDTLNVYFALKIGSSTYLVEVVPITMDRSSPLLADLESNFTFTEVLDGAQVPVPFATKSTINFQLSLSHKNTSQAELYRPVLRFCLPKFIEMVQSTDENYVDTLTLDAYVADLNGTQTKGVCIDYSFDFLLFLDPPVTFNFTATVDPYDQMNYGLDVIDTTALFKLLAAPDPTTDLKYQQNTKFVNFKVQGPDCEEDLQILNFDDCQIWASTAIDETVSPSQAAKSDGKGWMPAIMFGMDGYHHITIDFRKKTRVTKIEFLTTTGERSVTKYTLHKSLDGENFVQVCPKEIDVNAGSLPTDCRFETRFARLVIVATSDPSTSKSIEVKFKWYGCERETSSTDCLNPAPATILTDSDKAWRQGLLNVATNQLYICDVQFVNMEFWKSCYSAMEDGASTKISRLPAYVRGLAGFDSSTNRVYGFTMDPNVLTWTEDGQSWNIVNTVEDPPTFADLPVVIPGAAASDFPVKSFGPWKANFAGIENAGTLKINWGT